MTLAFTMCLVVLFALAAIGTPIAHSIIIGALVYLAIKGQDLGIAAEQISYGLYDSFVLLAVPLFIVAANIMNAGAISERLLRFCVGVVGRFKGGLGHVNIVSSLIFSGMSGSAVATATAAAMRPPSPLHRRRLARSFRHRFRWCCMRWCRTLRSATCSWAASCQGC